MKEPSATNNTLSREDITALYEATKRTAYIEGLRAFADLLEAHSAVPIPNYGPYFTISECTKDQLQAVLDAVPKARKSYYENSFSLQVDLVPWTAPKMTEGGYIYDAKGDTTLNFQAERTEVCERVVVGKKIVPEQYIPGHTVEQHEEEIVEWKCKPLLEESPK